MGAAKAHLPNIFLPATSTGKAGSLPDKRRWEWLSTATSPSGAGASSVFRSYESTIRSLRRLPAVNVWNIAAEVEDGHDGITQHEGWNP
jgi:hypothetical protein